MINDYCLHVFATVTMDGLPFTWAVGNVSSYVLLEISIARFLMHMQFAHVYSIELDRL